MTPLRAKMIEAMQVRGFSPRTHQSYLAAVAGLAGFYGRSPDTLTLDEVRDYLVYLVVTRKLAAASCRVALHGVRFFFLQVQGRREFDVTIPVPKRPQRIPELLTQKEVERILAATANPKQHALLATCYGCGLRVTELVGLKVRHLDGDRNLLRVDQGKGAKDRNVTLKPALLAELRQYWKGYRPADWLFPGRQDGSPISVSTAQKVFARAKAKAGIAKVGGIHSLRHAYATHQLASGLSVPKLQHQLGHRSLQSTLRYVHWVPDYAEGKGVADLLAALAAQEVDHD
ncbi:site-specific integrase [Thiohalocapsa sp.]|uniref:tyrosine-type recombinase/integrase n=1 Tax=Thiohalocapsa sp. TaxID=2497641 RepID=UPI0025CF3972|nr:site-specific integrase [Thiohalocapsa sp.]